MESRNPWGDICIGTLALGFGDGKHGASFVLCSFDTTWDDTFFGDSGGESCWLDFADKLLTLRCRLEVLKKADRGCLSSRSSTMGSIAVVVCHWKNQFEKNVLLLSEGGESIVAP